MAERVATSKRESEPTGQGHELLELWAYWYRGGLPGGAGEWSVRERVGPARDIAPPEEAQAVEAIVAQIGSQYPVYRRMIKRYYLDRQAYWEVAAHLQYTVGFVRLSIQAVCDWVARLYDERGC